MQPNLIVKRVQKKREMKAASSIFQVKESTVFPMPSSGLSVLSETPQIQSPSILKVLVTVILESTNLPPILETPVSTAVSSTQEFDALFVVQLIVAKLEKDVSEIKKINLSAEALAALKTHVPSKYSLTQTPEIPKNQTPTVDLEQKSEKSPLEILKIKKEQAEKQKMPQFTIKSTDKAAL
ncbi:hypothetical protein Tco_0949606 [Tanacetum coccineum]